MRASGLGVARILDVRGCAERRSGELTKSRDGSRRRAASSEGAASLRRVNKKSTDWPSIVIGCAAVGTLAAAIAGPFVIRHLSEKTETEIREWVPAAAAVFAFASFLLAAWVFNRGVIERRRERTLEAWEAYVKVTGPLIRRELTTSQGQPQPVPAEEARDLLLVRRRPLASASEGTAEHTAIRRVHGLFDILNAIERLAVGTENRAYDVALLGQLGKTRLASVISRLDILIKAAQTEQVSAFAALRRLEQRLDRMNVS